jgi:TPR repeat protein
MKTKLQYPLLVFLLVLVLVTLIGCNSKARLIKKAEQGDVEAQLMLGDCYYNGKEFGISGYGNIYTDHTEAVKWWRKAAEQGNAEAQYQLGCCYRSGAGVQKDLTQTVKWWRRAAERGLTKAQYNLEDLLQENEDLLQENKENLR